MSPSSCHDTDSDVEVSVYFWKIDVVRPLRPTPLCVGIVVAFLRAASYVASGSFSGTPRR